MRVAISGTHCCGKSTLIDAFVSGHDEYIHEPEPYEVLYDLHGEGFGAEPSAEDFFRQLEYQVERLRQYGARDRVIFERCPADFLAYMFALDDMGRAAADTRLAKQSIALAASGLALLDLIAYLPEIGEVPEAEDPELRRAVDARLQSILLDDDFGLLTEDRPSIIEIVGTTTQRLRSLEAALR
jgi:hypothetical protein